MESPQVDASVAISPGEIKRGADVAGRAAGAGAVLS
jgi:hypothetical protein